MNRKFHSNEDLKTAEYQLNRLGPFCKISNAMYVFQFDREFGVEMSSKYFGGVATRVLAGSNIEVI